MELTGLFTEGDINLTKKRQKKNQKITDPSICQVLANDARYFLHQSMSAPCLDSQITDILLRIDETGGLLLIKD